MPRATPDLVGEWGGRLAQGDASVAQVLAPSLLAEVGELLHDLTSARSELARLRIQLGLGAGPSAGESRDELAQRPGVDRLGERGAGVPLEKRKRSRRERAPRHEGDARDELRSGQLDFLEKLDPVDVRHLEVEEEGVPALARLEAPQRLGGGGEDRDLVVP
ncbi:MAG TPA: hypothetical protein VF805_11095, partial [Anaeromyxobacteraceae bacterium]